MPPLKDYKCSKCGVTKEYLLLSDSDKPKCCSRAKMSPQVSAHGGYAISGWNPSSQRPKQAGSFKGRVKK